MMPYSEQRNHCLISGLQLLTMVRACMAEPDRAGDFAKIILETSGVVDGWDSATELFDRAEVTVETAPVAVASKDAAEQHS
ncbi:hypothetical protein DDP54_10375 [Cellulomonas sp. WB94]|nr:hypothetical protein DDP54_10375 [Cellulomonas sp. WB94]